MSIRIRGNNEIKGIVIDNTEFKSGQFADDMLLFLQCHPVVVETAISTLKIFNLKTGMKLNFDKGNMYNIGKNRMQRPEWEETLSHNIQYCTDCLNVLGVDVFMESNGVVSRNYDNIIAKI